MPYSNPYLNPYYPQYYNQPVQPQPTANNGTNSTQQIQSGGFISVRNMEEARNYPVAPGNSITFKDETAPYVYTKTMGFSQLDRPIFEKYKLVKEKDIKQEQAPDVKPINEYASKQALDAVISDINGVREEIREIQQHLSEIQEDDGV